MHAVILGAGWSVLVGFLTAPTLDVPWPARITLGACNGVVFGVFTAAGMVVSQQRAFGDRLTAAQRAHVEAIVRGRESPNDPRLSRAAFCLAREWTSWRTNLLILGPGVGVGLAMSFATAIVLAPQFWVSTAILVVAGPVGLWLAARNRAAGRLFLATASPPPAAVGWVPWVEVEDVREDVCADRWHAI